MTIDVAIHHVTLLYIYFLSHKASLLAQSYLDLARNQYTEAGFYTRRPAAWMMEYGQPSLDG